MPKIVAILNPNSIPSTSQLALGDLAINSYDGKAFIKKQTDTSLEIVEIGSEAILPFVSYAKDADQNIIPNAVVTFPADSELSAGASFGSMAATGVFTFTRTGNYLITISYNTSLYVDSANPASLDIWGKVNDSNSPRYTQIKSTGIFKSSISEVVPITNIGDNFRWYSNNSCTVYGTGDTKTRINIVKLS